MEKPQSYQNHVKIVPLFHLFVLPVFGLNVLWAIYRCVRFFSWQSVEEMLVALALAGAAVSLRLMALTVQDRVIRLEMRLRMQSVLPSDMRGRIGEFSAGQLVALRFASDRELPELARKVLDEKLTDRAAIKKMVQNWQADYLRA
ncbi:MAG TPA: DUF6526 family protein [Candidatus Limnocylindrales bacterium]|nr:DUF6526 family protein [Candidatus Limnocylindrales bacterium]